MQYPGSDDSKFFDHHTNDGVPHALVHQGTPVWVVIQHGECITATGGGVVIPLGVTTSTTQPTTTTTLDPARCVVYTFVSATTGKRLYGEG